MADDSYKTIKALSEGYYTEKRSRFISYAIPVRTVEEVKAQVEGECARCLAPVQQAYDFTREYLVRLRDLDDPDFELPLDEKGCLDLRELVYQELIFEVPRVLLCSPDCPGLCPICGKRKADGCSCQTAEAAAPTDARLSILKQLLS